MTVRVCVCVFACVGYEPCLPSDQVVHVTKETLPLVVQSLNPVLRSANKASSCKHHLSGSQKHNKTQECCSHTDVLHISYLIMSTSFIPFSSFLVLIIILWHSSTFLTQHFTQYKGAPVLKVRTNKQWQILTLHNEIWTLSLHKQKGWPGENWRIILK